MEEEEDSSTIYSNSGGIISRWRNIRKAGGIMPSDISYVGQTAAVTEYQ
jgi:hypothetical protein